MVTAILKVVEMTLLIYLYIKRGGREGNILPENKAYGDK
jgi:hypothetical protein